VSEIKCSVLVWGKMGGCAGPAEVNLGFCCKERRGEYFLSLPKEIVDLGERWIFYSS